jgi:hypothetical protein
MPYLLERHRVRDYARWREVFEADAQGRKDAGCLGVRIFRNAENPEEVVVRWIEIGLNSPSYFLAGLPYSSSGLPSRSVGSTRAGWD